MTVSVVFVAKKRDKWC